MGSTRDDQSEFEGGTSIHSSRWGFLLASASASCVARSLRSRSACCAACEPGAGGSEGPKPSESEDEAEWAGDGGVEGRSERGAGGGAGPIVRWRLEVVEEEEALREGGDGERRWGGDEERLRLVR